MASPAERKTITSSALGNIRPIYAEPSPSPLVKGSGLNYHSSYVIVLRPKLLRVPQIEVSLICIVFCVLFWNSISFPPHSITSMNDWVHRRKIFTQCRLKKARWLKINLQAVETKERMAGKDRLVVFDFWKVSWERTKRIALYRCNVTCVSQTAICRCGLENSQSTLHTLRPWNGRRVSVWCCRGGTIGLRRRKYSAQWCGCLV